MHYSQLQQSAGHYTTLMFYKKSRCEHHLLIVADVELYSRVLTCIHAYRRNWSLWHMENIIKQSNATTSILSINWANPNKTSFYLETCAEAELLLLHLDQWHQISVFWSQSHVGHEGQTLHTELAASCHPVSVIQTCFFFKFRQKI